MKPLSIMDIIYLLYIHIEDVSHSSCAFITLSPRISLMSSGKSIYINIESG